VSVPPKPTIAQALAAAVEAVNGSPRDGQQQMANEVAAAFDTGQHLLVQAGTGTGKSLAYLVPAILHKERVVVSTATIALQRQLVERDLPLLADALEPLGVKAEYAILKGRQNYLCLHRLNEGIADEDGETLFEPAPTSALGRDVLRIRTWADETETGDRDELAPAPMDRAWRSLSVSSYECLGPKCGYAAACWAEQAKERAKRADVVITNHALLAIDALDGIPLLPEHDAVVIDEAHELVDRATSAATQELSPAGIERAAKRARRYVEAEDAEFLDDAAALFADVLGLTGAGRVDKLDGLLFDALVALRDAGHRVITRWPKGEDNDANAKQVRAAVELVHRVAGEVVGAGDRDVVWIEHNDKRGSTLKVAPLSVATLLREQLFAEHTVVLTSATLQLGGSFEPLARTLGLTGGDAPPWEGIDVGSPFDYPSQGILYVAAHLPPPTQSGPSPQLLDELEQLIRAAGGRTLGLFSSMRAAEDVAESMRERLGTAYPIRCQGEDATHALVSDFASEPTTSLFGTLSLWQGVDVPGDACTLVVIDRIPFPRPDDPLQSARARDVEAHGGNGFMQVSVAVAALKLAQGAGRLIRSGEDRGVVAVLDSRLKNARYSEFLVRSLPAFWRTTDGARVRDALRRLDARTEQPV
jgi:ATP-dependent DNA helicase DinG